MKYGWEKASRKDRAMTDDPLDLLDGWRQTLAKDRRRAELLPQGQVKNLLNKKLREMMVILEVVGALPENEPFRCRVKALARRMKETPSANSEQWGGVLKEFADCATIARSMKRIEALRDANAKPW
jgi:hypothetical protein